MIVAIEVILCCIFSGIYIILRTKIDAAYRFNDMPIKLKKKIMHMRGYRNRGFELLSDWQVLCRKLPFYVICVFALTAAAWVAGARSFSSGFTDVFVLWVCVTLFVCIVIDCGWYAHSPKFWIKGTEDKADKYYQNYKHYFGLVPTRIFVGVVVAVVAGFLVDSMPRLEKNNYSPAYQEINDTLTAACEDYNIPGMAVEIVDAEGVWFEKTYGECESIDQKFMIGSLSKSLTAACIMKLEEQDKLDLNDEISRYIDTSEVMTKESDADIITIRQLLNHTSGLGIYQQLGDAKIVNKNGKYTYADINYEILGKIIENASGKSYNNYLTRYILSPLGMKNTTADYNAALNSGNVIEGHMNLFGFSVPSTMMDLPKDAAAAASDSVVSSASDMARFLQMFLRGGYGILSEKSLQTMLYSRVSIDDNSNYGYGMGWVYSDDYIEPVYNHTGTMENYMSDMYLLTESGVGIVILVNTDDYLVTKNLMEEVSSKVVLTVMGYDSEELDGDDYWDIHLFYDLIYAVFIAFAIFEIIKAKNWKLKNEGSIVRNIIVHLFLPVCILLTPIFIQIPYTVAFRYVPDVFTVAVIGAVLLLIGGGLKLRKRRG